MMKKKSLWKKASLAFVLVLAGLGVGSPVAAQTGVAGSPGSFITTEFLASHALLPINAQYAYSKGYTGKGVLIAIVDSGLDIDHPEFADRISSKLRSFSALSGPYDVSDLEPDGEIAGHGTHVTGLAGAGRNGFGMHGVAYNATLLPIRAIDSYTANAPYNAVLYAAQNGAQVLNGSYGPITAEKFIQDDTGRWVPNPNWQLLPTSTPGLFNSQATYEVLMEAAQADVLLVYAAGNEYQDQPNAAALPSGAGLLPLITPANTVSGLYKFVDDSLESNVNDPSTWTYIAPSDQRVANLDFSDLRRKIIVVVSTDREGEIASYSNRCGAAAAWCIAAPGGDFYDTSNYSSDESQLWSTYPYSTYTDMAGTSMASPVVAGSAAVLREAFPYMTAEQVIEVVLTTANSTGIYADQSIYGRGFLDLRTAIQGPIEFGAWGFDRVFDVNTQGYDSLWSNDIRGSGGLIKRGDGALVMSGQNTYTGATQVLGGMLVVNGSIASSAQLTIGEQAILGGDGVVGDTQVAGRVAPGNSIGTLTVDGSYQQLTGSVLEIEINEAGQSDRVNVTGTADIQGAKLEVLGLRAGALGQDFSFFSAGSLTAGSYFDASALDRAFIDINAVMSGASFDLQVRRNNTAFTSVAETGNQRATAAAIAGQGLGGGAYDEFVLLPNAAQGAGVLDQLSGEIYASTQSALLDTSSALYRASVTRLFSREMGASYGGPLGQVSRSAPGGRHQLWMQALGSWGSLGATSDAQRMTRSIGGLMFGGDTPVGQNGYAGLAMGLTTASYNAAGNSDADTDGYHLMSYLGWSADRFSVRGGLGQSWYRIDTRRNIAYSGLGQAKSKANATSTQLFAELAYALSQGAAVLEPYWGLQRVWLTRDGFDESGSVVALSGDKSRQAVTFSRLGLRMRMALSDSQASSMLLTANIGWRRAWGDLTPEARLRFASGPAYDVSGATLSRDALVAELGIEVAASSNSVVSFGYAGQFGGGSQDHGLQARLAWQF
ncbi:MAG TPA: hypothetical protein DEB15_11545 [Pusillimonas sp.]|jgi:subtilase-type serine protease|nr:hypothetical protein [Pusillimonas sp.]HBT33404.1 hypothetical protein [Pusillimonas sp.]|tara:strand:- start:67939 stop:70935 length:2997 start_codon:yes stop_codon:yes gene_type:complete